MSGSRPSNSVTSDFSSNVAAAAIDEEYENLNAENQRKIASHVHGFKKSQCRIDVKGKEVSKRKREETIVIKEVVENEETRSRKRIRNCSSWNKSQPKKARTSDLDILIKFKDDIVEANSIRNNNMNEFFNKFWVRKTALDRRNYKQVVDTTVEIASKVGVKDVVGRIVNDLEDESEAYRCMVMETIEKVLATSGVSDIDSRLVDSLVEGILYAFIEQTSEDDDANNIIINGFAVVVDALSWRIRSHWPQIWCAIKWRLTNESAKLKQQAADLISRIVVSMEHCGEEQLILDLGDVLFDYLGEENPELLGSVLGALASIVDVIGVENLMPPMKQLLSRLTPILKNRHEKVRENCIELVRRVVDNGGEFVPVAEWMRMSLELLEMLRPPRISTFQ